MGVQFWTEKRTDTNYCKHYTVFARPAGDDKTVIEVSVEKRTRVVTDPASHWMPAEISLFTYSGNAATAEAMAVALREAAKLATMLDAEVR